MGKDMPKENKKKDFWALVQVAGLAFAIPFEVAAGPFVGYFIGDYLRHSFGVHRYIVFILIAAGFAAGITNVVLTVKMMIKISKKSSWTTTP